MTWWLLASLVLNFFLVTELRRSFRERQAGLKRERRLRSVLASRERSV